MTIDALRVGQLNSWRYSIGTRCNRHRKRAFPIHGARIGAEPFHLASTITSWPSPRARDRPFMSSSSGISTKHLRGLKWRWLFWPAWSRPSTSNTIYLAIAELESESATLEQATGFDVSTICVAGFFIAPRHAASVELRESMKLIRFPCFHFGAALGVSENHVRNRLFMASKCH